MNRFNLFAAITITIVISCTNLQNKTATEIKTIMSDSVKKELQQKYWDELAKLDSAIGASRNTIEDSLYIIGIKDTLLKMEPLLDSLSVEH